MSVASIRTMTTLRRAAKKMPLGGALLAQSLLRRCFRHAKGMARINDFDGDLTVDLSLSEHMQRRIFWMGYYSREVIAFLARNLRHGMVAIDVGANIGEITMVAAKRVGRTGKIISFEPVDAIAEELERNVARNHLEQVTVVRLGLSDTDSIAPIYPSCGQGDAHDEHHGLGSLYGSATGSAPLQTIELVTLDSYLEKHPVSRLDVIKIDIEGAELPCLMGASRTIAHHRPILIVEIQEHSSHAAGYRQTDILDYLISFGYNFYAIGRKGTLRELQARMLSSYQNVVCIPTHAVGRLP